MTDPSRVIHDLRELAALTSDDQGAQRVAWSPVWQRARAWFAEKLRAIGLQAELDAAGNSWATIPGRSRKTVVLGSHLDSVPNGGWLDGALGVLAALEALRVHGTADLPVTLRLVEWADEEGRFGMSLLGSSAAAGRLDLDAARAARDRNGVALVDALRDYGLNVHALAAAHQHLSSIDARAYLELHIEQGPVLASLGAPAGAVVGTFGVERHLLRFAGQAAHAGSTPLPLRRDAFLAAAQTAVECREAARRRAGTGVAAVCTTGFVSVQPNIPTAIAGACEMSLDMRSLEPSALAAMLAQARSAADASAAANQVSVEWRQLWHIEPRAFDETLVRLCEDAIREETGQAPRLPSGPVHDATEMAALMPAVMLFAASPNGLSHCREEDTPEGVLEQAIRAYVRLVGKTIGYVGSLKSEV
jgi:N-carbamoyl-L-amino-acid hydrolase